MTARDRAGDRVVGWLVSWLRAKGARLGADASEQAADLFELGVVDSLGLLELIAGLEEEFGVRFSDESLQDPRFTTIGGLAEIVGELDRSPIGR